MKFKVREILDSIDENDLYKMQSDLSHGGVFLKKLVDDRLKQLETKKQAFCTTCGQPLHSKFSTYTLLFGPEDFKKKASFCEIDCLEYFLRGLREMNRAIRQKGDMENGV